MPLSLFSLKDLEDLREKREKSAHMQSSEQLRNNEFALLHAVQIT